MWAMASGSVLIGILDSGVGEGFAPLDAQRAFFGAADGSVEEGETELDRLEHGGVIARIIAEAAPEVRFLNAQIFHDRMTATPAAAAAGLDWLSAEGARVVTMSFGLRNDRAVLRDACARAVDAGVILLASAPARGGPVFPAAYDGVMAISGDARLGPGELSDLATEHADFGAYAWPSGVDKTGRPQSGGASFAVATVAIAVAGCLRGDPRAGYTDIMAFLKANSRYRGPERRK